MKRIHYRHRIMAIAVILLPMALCLALLGANSAQITTYGAQQAAIVNNDEMVTLSTGQTLPAGRQMIAALTDPSQPSKFKWAVVTDQTAQAGLRDGTYAAVVTIPQRFSAEVAGVLQSTSTTPATITVQTNGISALLADVSNDVVQAAAKDLGTSFTVSYLSESLAASSQLKDGFEKAADGADQLASGITQAADGADQLASGAAQLNDGNKQLASGTNALTGGIKKLADGTAPLYAGANKLAGGLAQYTDGVIKAADGSVPLAAGAQQLSDGVTQYVDGVQQLHDGIVTAQPGQNTSMLAGAQQLAGALTQVATLVHKGIDAVTVYLPDGLSGASQGVQGISDQFTRLKTLITQCQAGNQQACDQAISGTAQAANQLSATAQKLQAAADAVAASGVEWDKITQLTEPMDQLVAGAQQLADGLGTMAEQIDTNMLGANGQKLTDGAQGLASGTSQLSAGLMALKQNSPALTSGAGQLSGGMQQLSTGAASASDGAAQLAAGANKAAAGTAQLSGGMLELADGQHQLADGSQELADQLASAAAQVPAYTRPEAEKTANALGTPVTVAAQSALVTARTALAPGLAALALWIGALSAIIYLNAMATSQIHNSLTPFAFTLRSLRPAAGFSLVQALLVLIGMAIAGVKLGNPPLTAVILLGASVTMMAVHLAFTAMFGVKGGTIFALIFLGLQLVSLPSLLPIATDAPAINVLHMLMPAAQTQEALTVALTNIGSLARPVWGLLGWLLVALVATGIAVAKRRTLSLPKLRDLVMKRLPLVHK